ncbi:metallophosphoesterase [Halobacillus naozhouensis]|uniref:metallophosphoesterase n=1 Tax=Halobacillus naozhouensis TaxID=554880 RepID=UPI003633137B
MIHIRYLSGIFLVGLWLIIKMFRTAKSDEVRIHSCKVSIKEPYTIFFISDIHNRLINDHTLAKIKDVDAVIIGGDLADRRVSGTKLAKNIKRLQTWGAPIYFIAGNNDHEFKPEPLLSYLRSNGVTPLSNEWTYIGKSGVTLSGIDPYFSEASIPALSDSHKVNILVVHEPAILKEFPDYVCDNYNLILTGHTHGGQIRLFGQGPYSRGCWKDGTHTAFLNSEGYGTSLVPLRLGTAPEVHLIRLIPR